MYSDTLNPGGEVRGCCVGYILGMPEISTFVFIAASYQLHGILKLKKCFFKRGCFGCGEISGVLIDTKSLLRGTIIIRTCDVHKTLYIPLFLLTIFGPDYYVPR